jgi:hypothetical protein
MSHLTPGAQVVLHQLEGFSEESVNAYGLSKLAAGDWSRTKVCLEVIYELARHDFVSLKNPNGHRPWGPECDHYEIDHAKVQAWIRAEQFAVRAAYIAVTPGLRERLSPLAV